MADNKQKQAKSDRLTFSQALGGFFNDLRQLGKLGLIGGLAAMFLREEQGRQVIKNIGELTGHVFERIGIEGDPIVKDVVGWSVHTYEQFRKTIVRAIGLIVLAASLSLLTSAYVEWVWLRGLVGTVGLVLVIYVAYDLWVRWIPVIIAVGAIRGSIDASAAKSAAEIFRNPFQILSGGMKGIPEGLTWVVTVWKSLTRICIWYAVGVLYITLVPLYQTPELIPAALPTIALFFMIPLTEPWLTRGTQYSWILWAGVMYLADIAMLAIFREELYVPILAGGLWARIIMVLIVAIEVIFAIKLARKTRGQAPGNPQVGSPNVSTAWGRPVAPRHEGFLAQSTGILLVLAFILLLAIMANHYLPMKTG